MQCFWAIFANLADFLHILGIFGKIAEFHPQIHFLQKWTPKIPKYRYVYKDPRPVWENTTFMQNLWFYLKITHFHKKQHFHKKMIIVGAQLAHYNAETVLENTDVDICVRGEGEITIQDIIYNLNDLSIYSFHFYLSA